MHVVLHTGLRTRSGHAAFKAPAKSWESGQRPRKLQPHEMPWARAARRAPSLAPQKSIAKPAANASVPMSLHSGSEFDAALLAEEEERAKEEAEKASAAAQQMDVRTAVSCPLVPLLCLLPLLKHHRSACAQAPGICICLSAQV